MQWLTTELNRRSSSDLGDAVAVAIQQAAGMSADFLGESRIAVRRVLKEENGILTNQERADLSYVLKQLDDALDKR